MPTPFMHLQIAERIWAQPELDTAVRALLAREWPAFYLGTVAPDFQTICDIPREKTHFYDLPPDPLSEAPAVMLARYPELAHPAALSSAQAVFIAAYSAHLMLDVRWYREVLVPLFIQSPHWQEHRQRFIIHNVLLTYLDKMALTTLPADAAAILAAATPRKWLPFAQDEDLLRWRDILVTQLHPGAGILTVEIYAQRLNLSPAEFSARLEDPAWMESQLFSRVPVAQVQELLDTAVAQSVSLITDYLQARG
jgi:hypothetical protein